VSSSDLALRSPVARLRVPALLASTGFGVLLAVGARLGLVSPPEGLSPEGLAVAGVVVLMAASWILEAMPVAATALLPMALFPLLGVASGGTVAKAYMSSAIMLLMGGFFLARGLERWGVPERIARSVSRWASGSPVRLLFGLMGATALLSMWVSNTATTLIMVTVALAAVTRAREAGSNAPEDVQRFRLALVLGIAYAANVGGMLTPIGTAPNVIFLGLYKNLAPEAPSIPFLEWMILSAPVVLILVPLIGLLLQRRLARFPATLDIGMEGAPLPPLEAGGRRALIIFGFTALLWVFRSDVDLEVFTLPGWADLLGLARFVDDGVVAIMGVALMFACPAGPREPGATTLLGRMQSAVTQERVLTWQTAASIPWYLLLLFGGGLALAEGFQSTGLSAWLGDQLVWLRGAPPWLVVLVLCLGMSLLTEVTSNTATTTLVLPVLFAAATPLGLPPLLLMWPAALCASAAFILPISTPPNAIAAGAGEVSPLEMARVGVGINLIAVVLITAVTFLWVAPRLGLG
jgi:solute carrier family 13 (sodium-dependent dicarboxylate transporter), member 2/3/5